MYGSRYLPHPEERSDGPPRRTHVRLTVHQISDVPPLTRLLRSHPLPMGEGTLTANLSEQLTVKRCTNHTRDLPSPKGRGCREGGG
jgi:hypothetical protein